MSISDKVKNSMASGSVIRKMFQEGNRLKKIYGADKVFDLSIGNPTLEPPEEFHRELKKLLDNPLPGMHRYMPVEGYAETCSAVANQLTADTGIPFKSSGIIMTCGTAGALNAILKALLNPGEEVITFAPYFFEYNVFADNHGGIIKTLPSDKNFNPNLEALEAGITAKTKAIIINSPNNPTGTVYNEQVLKQLAEVVTRKSTQLKTRIYIISDDVYCRIYFEESRCPRIASYYPHSIIATSYSKDLSLPGERIGYAAVHPDCENTGEVAGGIVYANRVLGYINAPALMQIALRNLQNITISSSVYRKKRDFLYYNLTKMGYRIHKPQGTFYIFPESPIPDDSAFVSDLMAFKVLVTPGSAFAGPGYFRIAYCLDDKILEGSLNGFREVLRKYSK